MTREEIVRLYNPDSDGIIRQPGKFESEMLYVPYFWDMSLEGGAEYDFGRTQFFKIDETDRANFPELGSYYGIGLEETSQGFVNSILYYTEREFKDNVRWAEMNWASEDSGV